MRTRPLSLVLKAAAALALPAFGLLPFGWMLLVSVSREPDFLLPGVAFAPTLEHYAAVLTEEALHLPAYLRNSLVVAAAAAALATAAAGLSAYAVTRLRFPGRVLVPLAVLAFSMFPQISIVGHLFRLLAGLGWINTWAGLIFPHAALGLPLALWIMVSHLARIPTDLDRAAMLDGASRPQILLRVLLPLAAPGAFSAALLVFIQSFGELLFALVLTTDYRARTLPVGIALFEGLHGQLPWGPMMAIAALAVLPVVLLAALFQRRIAQGLLQGAVKG